MRDDEKKGAGIIHVKVTVQQSGSTFDATYDPPIIPVRKNNEIIRFSLDMPTPDDIVIDTIEVPPSAQEQIGTPVISSNGKQVEITDKNTVKGTFHLTFTYKDKRNNAACVSRTVGECADDDYPQIDNDPPG